MTPSCMTGTPEHTLQLIAAQMAVHIAATQRRREP